MEIKTTRRLSPRQRVDALILPLRPTQIKTELPELLGEGMQNWADELKKLAREEDFDGQSKRVLVLHPIQRTRPRRIVLMGLGPVGDTASREHEHRLLALRAVRLANRLNLASIALRLDTGPASDRRHDLRALAEGAHLAGYRFDRYRSQPDGSRHLKTLILVFPEARPASDRARLTEGGDLAEAITLARDLVNEPACQLTPRAFASRARRVARSHELTCQVLDSAAIHKKRLRLIEAVSSGSREPARVIKLRHRGSSGGPRVVLVGKGITFDAGGLDIKTAAGMLGMKIDMAGAAAVLGTMMAVARRGLRVDVTAYLGCCENLLGAGAYKPGDVIVSHSGRSVEIGNTDAEGRLILADLLSLSREARAQIVVDVATLTGACMVALGPLTAGLFCNDDGLAADLLQSGAEAGESWWRLPLTSELREQLKSSIADLKNTGGRMGGAISAALFLQEFVPDSVRWAHLDIAGPSSSGRSRGVWGKGGTGFAVATLFRWIESISS